MSDRLSDEQVDHYATWFYPGHQAVKKLAREVQELRAEVKRLRDEQRLCNPLQVEFLRAELDAARRALHPRPDV